MLLYEVKLSINNPILHNPHAVHHLGNDYSETVRYITNNMIKGRQFKLNVPYYQLLKQEYPRILVNVIRFKKYQQEEEKPH